MGMAASQARLLCLTARIHDVEYQAQTIQEAKVQLATQSDQVYNNYLEALDATTLTVTKIDPNNGNKAIIAANFNNLAGINRVTPADGSNYLLRDVKGRLIVDQESFDAYNKFISAGFEKTPYMFAMYMLGDLDAETFDKEDANKQVQALRKAEFDAANEDINENDNVTLKELRNKVLEFLPESERDNYDSVYSISEVDSEYIKDYKDALNKYLRQLYSKNSEQIFVNMFSEEGYNKEDFDQALFNRYVDMFKEIQYCGGCVSITDYNGFAGDAANDSEWLQNMVKSGQITIETLQTDKRTGDINIETASPSSELSVSYTTTTQIDSTAVAKAEAKYQHDLKEIDRKDKKFDMSLSKLDTERKALDTQRESLKKVIEKNIDNTFGIFS